MSIYADTSFFVSLYVRDQHSEKAHSLIEGRPEIWLTSLHRAEWTHALNQHVFHREISARQAQQLFRNFEHDRQLGLWIAVSLPERAWETCVELARRHCAHLGNRTLDTLHVASALELNADAFWTFDARQAKLAKAEGLPVT